MPDLILQQFNCENGLELVIDTQTGECFASQRALARMCGKALSTIQNWIQGDRRGDRKIELKEAQIQTGSGFQVAMLLDEPTIYEALAKYNPQLLCQCAKAGLRVYLHMLAGFTVTSSAVEPSEKSAELPQTYKEALIALVKQIEAQEILEAQNKLLQQQTEQLSEAVDELFEYSSIIRVAKFNELSETAFQWSRLKAVCQVKGLEIKKAPCPRYGSKNLYPHEAWRIAYPDARLPETTTLTIRKDSAIA